MKKLLIGLCALLLAGCCKPEIPKDRLVTAVTVKLPQRTCYYTEPQKMETVLAYLRFMKRSHHVPADPEGYVGDSYRIELHYCDGTTRYIFQQADRFLSEDFLPWQEIQGQYGTLLLPLLENMEND